MTDPDEKTNVLPIKFLSERFNITSDKLIRWRVYENSMICNLDTMKYMAEELKFEIKNPQHKVRFCAALLRYSYIHSNITPHIKYMMENFGISAVQMHAVFLLAKSIDNKVLEQIMSVSILEWRYVLQLIKDAPKYVTMSVLNSVLSSDILLTTYMDKFRMLLKELLDKTESKERTSNTMIKNFVIKKLRPIFE